ncbi:hypothetical protein BC831DRAFT_497821 [Entophlyctis helioformis]|nr:hypothetical protein BC831DRAFT_497821 [Entophlyctis helioformis]
MAKMANADADADADTETLTAVEFLARQTQLEAAAAEALPDDFSVCSFSQGYVVQRVYSCRTCSLAAGRPVGCHTTHHAVELFERRHFRCDCGTLRNASHRCELDSARTKADQTNAENKYNHNFDGIFCVCNQVYDPDSETSAMFQCVMCQDWLHDRCIPDLPDEDEFDEFICKACVAEYPFLAQYDPDGTLGMFVRRDTNATDTAAAVNANGKRALGVETADPAPVCPLASASGSTAKADATPRYLFCREDWRSHLCRCDTCLAMYSKSGIEYLVHKMKVYEPPKDESAGDSLLDAGMKQLDRVDRVQAINGVHAYNRLKDRLMGFLRTFGETGKVVTKDDIDAFFAAQADAERKKKRVRM